MARAPLTSVSLGCSTERRKRLLSTVSCVMQDHTNAKISNGRKGESVQGRQLSIGNTNIASFCNTKGHSLQQRKNDKVDSTDGRQTWCSETLQSSQIE